MDQKHGWRTRQRCQKKTSEGEATGEEETKSVTQAEKRKRRARHHRPSQLLARVFGEYHRQGEVTS
jgi:hypothetical protein